MGKSAKRGGLWKAFSSIFLKKELNTIIIIMECKRGIIIPPHHHHHHHHQFVVGVILFMVMSWFPPFSGQKGHYRFGEGGWSVGKGATEGVCKSEIDTRHVWWRNAYFSFWVVASQLARQGRCAACLFTQRRPLLFTMCTAGVLHCAGSWLMGLVNATTNQWIINGSPRAPHKCCHAVH